MKIFVRLINRHALLTGIKIVTVLLVIYSSIRAQEVAKVNHLTLAEDEIIHDAQELDKRIEIFVKVIDRRFLALNGGSTTIVVSKENKETKKKDKDADKLGPLPTGTRVELLGDVKNILEEAVSNVDNAAEHNQKNALLPKALQMLSDGCSRFVSQLKPFYDSAQNEMERGLVYDATENCQDVITANSGRGATNSPK